MTLLANPYASQDLLIDSELHARFSSYTRIKNSTFPRWIDAWWLGLCVGDTMNRRIPLPEGRDRRTKFNDGGILSSDPWRITHLELIALAHGGDEALTRPSEIIRLANELANGGLLWIADALLGEAEPTLRLLNELTDLTNRPAAPEIL